MSKAMKWGSRIFSLAAGCAAVVLLTGMTAAFAAEAGGVTPQELKQLLESKADIVVVDAQPEGAYAAGHVPGAVNLPWLPNIESAGDLPTNKDLILYCACVHDEDSTDLAKQLVERFGYDESKVKLLEGGWLKWIKLGYPQEKTAN